jgi:hypothetical protein
MTRFSGFGAELLSAAAGLLVVACGGEGGSRPDKLHGGGTPYQGASASLVCEDNPYATYPACYAADPGSGPFDCPTASTVVGNNEFDTVIDGAGYHLLMVEDFETGATSDGAWYTNNEFCYRCVLMPFAPDGGILPNSYPIVPVISDDACAARCDFSQYPPRSHFQKPVVAAGIQNGGRCGSQYAMRLRGPLTNGPFTDWGMQFNRDMTGSPFDAGTPGWEGVSFWARVGPASRSVLRFAAADKYTWEKYINPDTGDSICVGKGRTSIDQYVDGGSTSGCDQAGSYFTLGPDWRFYALPFSEMRQAGWGMKEPFFDIWGIMAMGFLTNPGAWWDVWIDDIAWYRRNPS